MVQDHQCLLDGTCGITKIPRRIASLCLTKEKDAGYSVFHLFHE